MDDSSTAIKFTPEEVAAAAAVVAETLLESGIGVDEATALYVASNVIVALENGS